ncbi:MAG: homoserine kinase [Acholeplasmatales bacterium]|nr:homoserine kinase [Acholeplasmatales bacterium]
MLRIKVEATSANLCVGFDTLGMALDIYNEFTFEKADDFGFKGFLPRYLTITHNLVYDSYIEFFKYINKEPIPVLIGFNGDIPVSRGMGSSSSLIVAGVFGANYISGANLSKDELFSLCANIEGHPDNVAPAIYGNVVASFKYDGKYYPNIYKVSNKLKFGVVIPSDALKTEDARRVLPDSYNRADIVNNLSRIVNLPKALEEGNLELIKMLCVDKIHEPYRKKLIKEFDDIEAIINKYNGKLIISGSGSTMLIISNNYEYEKELLDKGYNFKRVNVGSGLRITEE